MKYCYLSLNATNLNGEIRVNFIVSHLVLFSYYFAYSGVISMTYYGHSLNVASLNGGIRVNFTVCCSVELIYCLAYMRVISMTF